MKNQWRSWEFAKGGWEFDYKLNLEGGGDHLS